MNEMKGGNAGGASNRVGQDASRRDKSSATRTPTAGRASLSLAIRRVCLTNEVRFNNNALSRGNRSRVCIIVIAIICVASVTMLLVPNSGSDRRARLTGRRVEVVKRDLGRTFNVLLPGLAREREGDDREVEMRSEERR